MKGHWKIVISKEGNHSKNSEETAPEPQRPKCIVKIPLKLLKNIPDVIRKKQSREPSHQEFPVPPTKKRSIQKTEESSKKLKKEDFQDNAILTYLQYLTADRRAPVRQKLEIIETEDDTVSIKEKSDTDVPTKMLSFEESSKQNTLQKQVNGVSTDHSEDEESAAIPSYSAKTHNVANQPPSNFESPATNVHPKSVPLRAIGFEVAAAKNKPLAPQSIWNQLVQGEGQINKGLSAQSQWIVTTSIPKQTISCHQASPTWVQISPKTRSYSSISANPMAFPIHTLEHSAEQFNQIVPTIPQTQAVFNNPAEGYEVNKYTPTRLDNALEITLMKNLSPPEPRKEPVWYEMNNLGITLPLIHPPPLPPPLKPPSLGSSPIVHPMMAGRPPRFNITEQIQYFRGKPLNCGTFPSGREQTMIFPSHIAAPMPFPRTFKGAISKRFSPVNQLSSPSPMLFVLLQTMRRPLLRPQMLDSRKPQRMNLREQRPPRHKIHIHPQNRFPGPLIRGAKFAGAAPKVSDYMEQPPCYFR